jgi:hypothetical protein
VFGQGSCASDKTECLDTVSAFAQYVISGDLTSPRAFMAAASSFADFVVLITSIWTSSE